MGDLKVTFLGNEYTIPADVLTYIDLLDFTDGIQKELTSTFVRKLKNEIAKDNVGLLGDEDMAAEIERQISKFVAKLCENGIYSRTISDYLKNNKGYQLCSDVNKAALEKMKSLLIQKMDAWQAGYESAVNKAESHVTGMGFSIISSSFVNHAIYAAMEASTLDKQGKEAEAQYKSDMADLNSRLEAKYGGEESNYINNTYIPNMEAALTAFAYELLDRYIADLIANGKFDSKALTFVDIGRSNELLKNLAFSQNKRAILENAFISCPYNIAVYMQAMKHEMLDFATFQTAKIFKQSDTILSFLRDSWGKVSYPGKFDINYYGANVLVSLTGQKLEDFLRVQTEPYAAGVIRSYAKLTNQATDKIWCRRIIEEFPENSILAGDDICKNKARLLVTAIVTESIWKQLTEQCGHTDLPERLKQHIHEDISIATKKDADNYFIEQLYSALETSRKEIADEIIRRKQEAEERIKEELRRKEEAERIRQEKKQQRIAANRKAFKVLLKVAAGVLAIIVIYFVCLFINDTVIGPAKQYKTAVAFMEAGDYQSARDIFDSLGGYKDSEKMIEQCNAADLEAQYNNAVQLMNDGNYIEAIIALRNLNGYKDSNTLLEECQSAYREDEYNYAVQLMNVGQYENAITVFEKLGTYNDCKDKIAECEKYIIDNRYIYAISLANDGSFSEAIDILEDLGDYRDAEDIIAQCRLFGCEVGDEIVFGSYEQDGNLSNGTEAIEWIVLDRDDNKILVLTKYCIEQMPFNDTLAHVTWANCSVRNWLNGYFWGVAFNNTERSQIAISKVAYPDDAEDQIVEGETMDWIFLLSENEVQNYLKSYASRKASATDYVATTHCYWLLRTHGSVSNVAHVDYKGYLGYYENVDRNWWIRPAMWIELNEPHFYAESINGAQLENQVATPTNPVNAEESSGEDFAYTVLSDGTISITEYLGNGTTVNIPSEIDGYTVSSIGQRAFRYCDIRILNIPATVTYIGEYAFADSSVASVSINGCTQIDAYAFYDCESLTQLTMADGVVSIGQSAFRYCGYIQSLELPGSITQIGEYAFADSGIMSLTINGCPTITDYAFYDCENLQELIIADGVKSIGQSAFRYCGNVKSLVIPSSVTTIGEYAFADSGIIALHLDGCPTIPDYAFYDCENLKELKISDGVLSIGQSAFRYAGNIASVTIPGSVTKIGEYAFANSGIIALNLDGCPTIPDYTFYDCENLTTLTISEGVKSIGQSAFRYCGDIKTLTIPASVSNMGEYVFANSGIKELYLEGCPRVSAYAFYDCENLKKLVISGNVNSIGQSAFRYCSALEILTIENSNIIIGENAFDNCDRLKNHP